MNLKRIIFLVLLVFIGQDIFSQTNFATIIAIDAKGRTDTVTFGQLVGSTLGVDSSLGEVDLFEIPYDSLDLRIIQRNIMCNNLNYSENIDLKKDFRPAIGSTWKEYSNFSFSISADTFPICIKIVSYEIDLFAIAYMYDNDCTQSQFTFICPSIDSSCTKVDTLFMVSANSPKEFRIYPEIISSINEINTKYNLRTYPNPTSGKVNLEIPRFFGNVKSIELFTAYGQKVMTTNNDIDIDLSPFEKGLYFIVVTNENDKKLTTKTLKL